MQKKLLMISTDRLIFENNSAVRARQIEYAKNFDEVHIVVFTKKNMGFRETSLATNCFVYPTNSSLKIKYPLDAIRLGQFIISRKEITDITCQDPFLTAMTGVSLKKHNNIQLEIQLHTDIGSPNYAKTFGNRVRKALALTYLPKADTIRVVSERIKEYLVEKIGISESKISIRPIFVDIQKIQTSPVVDGADLRKKYSQFDKLILMASRIEKEKNIGLAIDAFSVVVRKFPNAGLIIIGDGSEKRIILSKIKKMQLEKNVAMEPWLDRNILISYYKTADIFLNTSLYEGYGMTLVEAKAAGCKIISTDVGVAREIGSIIAEFNTQNVAEEIMKAIK